MNIEKDKVVSIHYKAKEGDEVLESSYIAAPMLYLHGHGGVFPALEEALVGKVAGDNITVTLTPEQAYGERDENAIQRVSLKHLVNQGKKKEKYRPGMIVYLNTKHGPQPAMVVKAGLKTLDVDVNHPFAGKTLTFEVEVMDVRDATEEELTHGHAHGAGGHQHA